MPKVLPVYILSAIVAIVALYAGLTNTTIWFIRDTRMAVIVLAAAGFLMCSTGAIFRFIEGGPAHPLTIAAYLIGAVALLGGLTQLFRWNVPLLADSRTALYVLAAATVLKVVIGRFAFLLGK